MGPTSPTTPEPECDTFAIASSGGGLTKRAVPTLRFGGGGCVACRVFTCACGTVQASIFPWPSPPGQAGFEFFSALKQSPRPPHRHYPGKLRRGLRKPLDSASSSNSAWHGKRFIAKHVGCNFRTTGEEVRSGG